MAHTSSRDYPQRRRRLATGRRCGESWRSSLQFMASERRHRLRAIASHHTHGDLGLAGFSKRVGALPTYPMAELPAIKKRLIEQGVDVIDVGAGDADFPPPDVAVQALARAARDPAMSRYAFQLGLPAFREAAVAYMQRRFG